MSELDDFLNNAHDEVDARMGTSTLVVGSQTIPVVWNEDRSGLDGIDGGLDDQRSATAVAQPRDVTTPYSLRGKRCTVGTENYRIADVSVGTVAITFMLTGLTE